MIKPDLGQIHDLLWTLDTTSEAVDDGVIYTFRLRPLSASPPCSQGNLDESRDPSPKCGGCESPDSST